MAVSLTQRWTQVVREFFYLYFFWEWHLQVSQMIASYRREERHFVSNLSKTDKMAFAAGTCFGYHLNPFSQIFC